MLYLIVIAVAYMLGAIPFGFLLVKIFRGEDIRLTGSGNIGATNVARSGAKGLFAFSEYPFRLLSKCNKASTMDRCGRTVSNSNI